MKFLRQFILNGIILTITSLILRCVGIFFNSYISQKIGTEAVGLYGLIMSVYGFGITIALSGINLATTKIVAEEIAIGHLNNIKLVVKKCLFFCVIFSSIASTLIVVFAPYVCQAWLHNKVSTTPFIIISISFPFISMASCISGYFTAVRNAIKPALDQIFEQTLKVILISAFLNYFMPSGLEYICISLVLGNIISEIISFVFIFILYLIDIKKYNINARASTYFEKKILAITIPVGLTSFIRSGLSTLKQVLIPIGFEKYGNSCEQALSNYGLITGMAMPIIAFPNIIVYSFSDLLIPEFTELNTRSESKKISNLSRKFLAYTLIFSLAVAFILFIKADNISTFMYKTNTVAPYIRMLAPLVPLMYIDHVIDAILKGLDKQVAVLKINILDLVTSIILIYTIIPMFGIAGYIFIIYFSESLNLCFSFACLIKTGKLYY